MSIYEYFNQPETDPNPHQCFFQWNHATNLYTVICDSLHCKFDEDVKTKREAVEASQNHRKNFN